MTQCLIKKNNAFTLLEMMMAVAFSVLLMAGVFGFYNTANQVYSSGITGQSLQDGANIVLSKIIQGQEESGTTYRFSTSTTYMIPNGVGTALYTCGGASQAAPCNASNSSSELYYCQDSPCTPTDATARWYYLNSAGTSIIYHHPASGGGTIEENIYTVPSGSTLNLRFSPAAVTTPANVVEIDVDLVRDLSSNITNSRLTTTSGAASTFVLLRNHP